MRVVALVNQKGGCGKTTTAVNLAVALGRLGQRALVIDNDPQGHATLALGYLDRDFTLSTHDLYLTSDILVEDARVIIGPYLDLVPAGIELSAVEPRLAGVDGRETRLRDTLRRSELPYDVVLVDCPPSVGMLTFNALLASSEVLVPVDASSFSAQAATRFLQTLDLLRERRGHDVLVRILLGNCDLRSRFIREFRENLVRDHGRMVLETMIHSTVRVREAAAAGCSVLEYDPNSRAARDFQALAREFLGLGAEPTVSALDHWTALLRGPEVTTAGVRFLAEFPRANDVRVSGSFNDWSDRGTPMMRRDDGRWECLLPIMPGAHEYRFIVDGRWLPDPHNETSVVNEFGGANSLVTVP